MNWFSLPDRQCAARWLGVWAVGLFVATAQAHSHRIEKSSAGIQPPAFGLECRVLTAQQSPEDFTLRISIANGLANDMSASSALTTKDFTLRANVLGEERTFKPTNTTLTNVFPAGRFVALSSHSGLLTLPLGSRTGVDVENLGEMSLEVTGFAPVSFACREQDRFTPLDWKEVSRRSPFSISVKSRLVAREPFPMRVLSMIVLDDELEFTVAFRNTHLGVVEWKGSAAGSDTGKRAMLITGFKERLRPSAVSESLRLCLGPIEAKWTSGEDYLGSLRFPRPSAESAHELTFQMPGYPDVILHYDAATKQWAAKEADDPQREVVSRVRAAMLGPDFIGLQTHWQQASKQLSEGKLAAFLEHFRQQAREELSQALANWEVIPGASIAFELSHQPITPDAEGRVRNVNLNLRYRLRGMPAAHEFLCRAQCSMQRDKEGRWHADTVFFPYRRPFWWMGLTQLAESKHFLLFGDPRETKMEQMREDLGMLEEAYRQVKQTAVPIGPRITAFIVKKKDTFAGLSGGDPLALAGVATMAYDFRDGNFVTVDQSLCINDFSKMKLQRAWAEEDRLCTMRHELIHVALSDYTRPWSAPWAVEGMAMFYAGQVNAVSRPDQLAALQLAGSLAALTRRDSLIDDAASHLELHARYVLAGETVHFLQQQRGGHAALLEFYAMIGGRQVPMEWWAAKGADAKQATARTAIMERALQKVYGISIKQLNEATLTDMDIRAHNSDPRHVRLPRR